MTDSKRIITADGKILTLQEAINGGIIDVETAVKMGLIDLKALEDQGLQITPSGKIVDKEGEFIKMQDAVQKGVIRKGIIFKLLGQLTHFFLHDIMSVTFCPATIFKLLHLFPSHMGSLFLIIESPLCFNTSLPLDLS